MVIISKPVAKETLDSRLAEFAPHHTVKALLKKVRAISKKTKDDYLSQGDGIRAIARLIDPNGVYFEDSKFRELVYDLEMTYGLLRGKEDIRKGNLIPWEQVKEELKAWQKSG